MGAPKSDAKLMCKIKIGNPPRACGRPKSLHSGKQCPACYVPIEHHDEAEQIECWENRARMAKAIQDAGPIELVYKDSDGNNRIVMTAIMNDIDREALRRCPDPDTLTADGYRKRSEL